MQINQIIYKKLNKILDRLKKLKIKIIKII